MTNKLVYFAALSLLCLTVASCQVQRAAGPYQPAKGSKKTATTTASTTPTETAATAPATDSKPAPEPVKQTVAPASSPATENVRRESFSVAEGEDKNALKGYNVVIGSFSKRENAQRLKTQMQPKYSPVIVVNPTGMFRVVLATYDDYQSARATIADIVAQFPDAWILVQL